MTERFGVAGALLVKLFGRPEAEAAPLRRAGRAGPRHRHPVRRCTRGTFFVAMLLVASLAQALTYGLGGWLAVTGDDQRRHRGHPRPAAHPPLRPAHRAVQRPGRRDERAGLVRPGLRGARPARPASTRSPTRCRCPGAPAGSSSATCTFRYPSAAEVSLASLEDVAAARPHGHRAGAARASPSPSSRGRWWPWSARPAPASRPPSMLVPGSTTSPTARCWSATSTSATPRSTRCATTIGVVTQDSHLFHETIAENLRYAKPDATDDELWAALRRRPGRRPGPGPARRAGHGGRRARLPLLRRREAAHRHRPAAAQGPVDRDPRRGDRPPRLASPRRRCSGPWPWRWPGVPRW